VTRFLLVRLEDDLHPSRVVGVFHRIALTPGVQCVFAADLTGLSDERLAVLTASPTPTQHELSFVELVA